MLVTHLCGKVVHRGLVADVDLIDRGLGARGADRVGGLVGGRPIAVGQHDFAGAAPGQLHRGGPADPGTGAGDQGELAAHLAPFAARLDRGRRAGDGPVDPLGGQPGDDVGARGHHPVPALYRDHPGALRNCAGEALQRGGDEDVPPRNHRLDRHGGLGSCGPGASMGAGMFCRYRLSLLT